MRSHISIDHEFMILLLTCYTYLFQIRIYLFNINYLADILANLNILYPNSGNWKISYKSGTNRRHYSYLV